MVMQRLGRDPAQFAQVEGPVAEALLKRTKHALTEIPIRTNPYLGWMLRGSYPDPAVSRRYLTKEGHAALREAREEIGLPSGIVEVLGTLPSHETVTRLRTERRRSRHAWRRVSVGVDAT